MRVTAEHSAQPICSGCIQSLYAAVCWEDSVYGYDTLFFPFGVPYIIHVYSSYGHKIPPRTTTPTSPYNPHHHPEKKEEKERKKTANPNLCPLAAGEFGHPRFIKTQLYLKIPVGQVNPTLHWSHCLSWSQTILEGRKKLSHTTCNLWRLDRVSVDNCSRHQGDVELFSPVVRVRGICGHPPAQWWVHQQVTSNYCAIAWRQSSLPVFGSTTVGLVPVLLWRRQMANS